MAKSTIKLRFSLDRHDVEGSNAEPIEILRDYFFNRDLESVDFLFENAINVECEKHYNPAAMLYDIVYRFELRPSDETMYRLKYSNIDSKTITM